jgi:hypothetical protein
MSARAVALRAPTIIETMRMNLSQAETALRNEDPVLLGRCIVAFGPMVAGLQAMAQDLGAPPAVLTADNHPESVKDILEAQLTFSATAFPVAPPASSDVVPAATATACPDGGYRCQLPPPWRSPRALWRVWRCTPVPGQWLSAGALTRLLARATGLALWRFVRVAIQQARSKLSSPARG